MPPIIESVLHEVFTGVMTLAMGWLGHVATQLIKDLKFYFDMARATNDVNRGQEDRIRKLEGKPPVTDEEWKCLISPKR